MLYYAYLPLFSIVYSFYCTKTWSQANWCE